MATNDEYLTEFTLKTHATGSYVSSLKSIPLFLVTIRDFSSIFALGSLHIAYVVHGIISCLISSLLILFV